MAIAAFGIIQKNEKILLVKISEPFRDAHKWNFPGGVIEEDEEVMQGLIREILEESNILAKIHSRIDSFDTVDPENTIHIHKGHYISGEIKFQEFELEDAGWFTIEEALNLSLAFNIRDYILRLDQF